MPTNNLANMVQPAANAAPLLFRTLTRAGFAREIGQIQRATNIYAMSFNLLMIVLQAINETQKKINTDPLVKELRNVKESVDKVEGGSNPDQNYFELKKAFNSMATKLERFYSCEGEVIDDELKPTEAGLRTCEKRCAGVPAKITSNMIKGLARFPKAFGNGHVFVVHKKKDKNQLEKFKCVESESKARLVCQCPRAPSFQLTSDMKMKLREFKKGKSSPRDFGFILVIAIVILAFTKSILLGLLLLFTASVWGPFLSDSAGGKRKKLPPAQ